MKKNYITAITVGVAAGTIGAVFAASVSSPAHESTPAAAAQASYLWGMGDATLLFLVFLSCVGLLAWKATRMRRNEYATVHGSMDGYTNYYTGAMLASVSHSVNR